MSAYSTAVLADGPILYGRLGEVAGSYADSSTTANPGTLTGSATTRGVASLIASDPEDHAIGFSGTATNYVLFPDHAAYRAIGDVITLEGWIATTTANSSILSFGSGGAYMRINFAGALQFLKSQTAIIGTTTQIYTDGLPHHVVVTKNGGTVKFYADGQDVTPTITNSALASGRSAGIYVGADFSGGPVLPWCTGTVDEVAVYNYALTQAQVQAHFAAAAIAATSVPNPSLRPLNVGRFA